MKLNLKHLILLPIVILFFATCSTMKQNISKNDKSTYRLTSSLLHKNGNVFYLTSTYSTISTVWTYGKNSIDIYKLVNGKISMQSTFPDIGFSQYEIPNLKDLDIEIKECGYELDGDDFGFWIKGGSEIKQQDLPINIGCFTKLKYKSEFLNKIVKDINTHKMWDVR